MIWQEFAQIGKFSFIEYLPDFEYDSEVDINESDIHSPSFLETYENDHQGSLSEQLYKEIDGPTTRMYSRIDWICFDKSIFFTSIDSDLRIGAIKIAETCTRNYS